MDRSQGLFCAGTGTGAGGGTAQARDSSAWTASRQRRLERLRTAQAVLEQREEQSKEPGTINPSDPDRGITPTAQGPFLQGYNAQAAVSAEGTTLIVGARVVQATNDRQQLLPTLASDPRPRNDSWALPGSRCGDSSASTWNGI